MVNGYGKNETTHDASWRALISVNLKQVSETREPATTIRQLTGALFDSLAYMCVPSHSIYATGYIKC